MSLIRNTAWSAFAALFLLSGRLLANILFAKTLGVTEFGKFVFSQWVIEMIFLGLAFGLPGSAGRFYAQWRTNTPRLLKLETWFWSRTLFILPAVALISSLTLVVFNNEENLNILLLQAGWAASSAFWALLLARAQGLQKFKRVAFSNGTYVFTTLIAFALLLNESMTVSLVMLIALFATILAAIVCWIPLPIDEKIKLKIKEKKISFRKVNIFGLNIWISGLVGAFVWSRGEIGVIRAELAISDLAIYSIALTLSGIATQGLMLLTGAIGPHLTQMWGTEKRVEAINLCRNFTDILTLTVGFLSLFLIIFSKEIIYLSYGINYVDAKVLLAILGLGAIGLVSAAPNQLIQIQTNGIFSRNINFIGAAVLFITSFVLIKFLGVEGAALSRALTQNFVGFATLYYAYRNISKQTVNWINQVKVGLIVLIVLILNYVNNFSIYLRISEFLASTTTVILILHNDNRKLIFLIILNKIKKYFYKKA